VRRNLVEDAFRCLRDANKQTGHGSRLYWAGMLRYFTETSPTDEEIELHGLVNAWDRLLTEQNYRKVPQAGDATAT
jgi:hypothetical protein